MFFFSKVSCSDEVYDTCLWLLRNMDPLFFKCFCSVLVVFISTRGFDAAIDIFNILSERLHSEHSNILSQIACCLFSVLSLNDKDSVVSHLSSLIPDLLNLFIDKALSFNFISSFDLKLMCFGLFVFHDVDTRIICACISLLEQSTDYEQGKTCLLYTSDAADDVIDV